MGASPSAWPAFPQDPSSGSTSTTAPSTVAPTTPPATGSSTTKAPTTPPSTTASTSTGCIEKIYSNGLSSKWHQNEWESTYLNDVAVTNAPLGVSKAIKWSPSGEWGGLLFSNYDCPMISNYAYARFWIYASPNRDWSFNVFSHYPSCSVVAHLILQMPVHNCDASNDWPAFCESTSKKVTMSGGTWKRVLVPLNTTCLRRNPSQGFTGFHIEYHVANRTLIYIPSRYRSIANILFVFCRCNDFYSPRWH